MPLHCYRTILPCLWLLPTVNPPQPQLVPRNPAAVWVSRMDPSPLRHMPAGKFCLLEAMPIKSNDAAC